MLAAHKQNQSQCFEQTHYNPQIPHGKNACYWVKSLVPFRSWLQAIIWMHIVANQFCSSFIPPHVQFLRSKYSGQPIGNHCSNSKGRSLLRKTHVIMLRTAIVTGANRGLGLATSLELLSRGYSVVMCVKPVPEGFEEDRQVHTKKMSLSHAPACFSARTSACHTYRNKSA